MANTEVKLYAIRSDGKRFTYQSDTWGILALTGIDFADVETFTKPRGFGDGDIITAQRRKSRDITITAKPKFIGSIDNERARAIAFHGIRYTFDIYITYLGTTRVAKDCVVKAVAFPTDKITKTSKLTVSFLSGSADLYSTSSNDVKMSKITPRWKSPRVYLANKPLMYATEESSNSIVINYEGTRPAPLIIRIKATGYVKNITVGVGTLSAPINVTLGDGDEVIIDSSKSYATLNGALITLTQTDSFDFKLFEIDNGENTVSVTAQTGTAYKTTIEYVGRYDGI